MQILGNRNLVFLAIVISATHLLADNITPKKINSLPPTDLTEMAAVSIRSFNQLNETRKERLAGYLSGHRGRWKFKGSSELPEKLMKAMSPQEIDSRRWSAMKADCKTDIRARFKGKKDDDLDWWFKLCNLDSVKNSIEKLNSSVDHYALGFTIRYRYVQFLNIAAAEIFSQVEKLKELKSMVEKVGSCAPVSEAQINRCLLADVKFREGIESFLADTQTLMDAFNSLPETRVLPSAKKLYAVLEKHRAEYVRILIRQSKHPIQGVLE